jgi:hypothetical protein
LLGELLRGNITYMGGPSNNFLMSRLKRRVSIIQQVKVLDCEVEKTSSNFVVDHLATTE